MEEEAFLLKSCFDGIIVMKLNVSNDYFFFLNCKQLSNGWHFYYFEALLN
jgi:hypothetical protein